MICWKCNAWYDGGDPKYCPRCAEEIGRHGYREDVTSSIVEEEYNRRTPESDRAGSVHAPETSAAAPEPQFVGIGGWLVFHAIGFVLGPIIGVVSLIAALALFSAVEAAGYGGIYALELFVQFALLVYVIYAATRFFGKYSNAPSTIITLLLVNWVSSGVLLVIELGAGAELFAIESGKQLAVGLITAAIWIPYFRVSKRVKATFVN